MKRDAAPAGFTLVELLVSLVISAIVIAGALALLTSQQHTFQRSSTERAMQENARVALESITGNLRLAGYGLEPALSFDFGAIPNVVLDRAPPGAVASVAGYQCPAAVNCRDSIAGPDEVVFHYRSPSFMRPLSAGPVGATPGSISMWGPLNQPLHAGQLLQVACFSGGMYWALVTVGAEVAADPAAVTVNVPLLPNDPAGAFGRQNSFLADTCFQAVAPPGSPAVVVQPAAKVFLVERFRYFVQTYDPGGNVVAWGTPGCRPYLMLDQGLADAAGNPLLQMVAPDVEDFQVSYVFPRSAAPVVGAAAGVAITADAAGIDLAPAVAPPQYSDPATAPSRATHFPSNIGAVRVSLVVRSAEADTTINDPAIVPVTGNRPDVAGPPNYRRARFDTSAATPNLDVRAPFFPSYSAGAADHLNVGGG
jgi:type IV pilus assembly protein PilW